MVTDGTLLKVYAWYDNEVGYACRMVDLANIVMRAGRMMTASVRNYLIVTASYWGFTLVDGALRMLVLLHFSKLGYSPFTLAFLFLLYEFAGIVANLGGGWLATRFGIPRMLAVGQALQIAGLLMLSALDPGLDRGRVGRLGGRRAGHRRRGQGPDQDGVEIRDQGDVGRSEGGGSGQLFRWVAWFTGSKNAMKGIGFFVGGLLLEIAGFRAALWMMAGLLGDHPRRRAAVAAARARQGQAHRRRCGSCSASRAASTCWRSPACSCSARATSGSSSACRCSSTRAAGRFLQVGAFLAAWTIGYGGVQAFAPQLVARSADGLSREVPAARLWSLILVAVPLLLAVHPGAARHAAAGSHHCRRPRAVRPCRSRSIRRCTRI